uniref:Integrase, catalytic region, zinc finger, CCHC-type, peptidase aspartic, catalytic n=1 Tax=Tanacetum cinerariifolium TaxID=118510 RepID=A0A6L2MHY3_TANCI|nr:integrase, catalytic region, zinc finger, CCHC-type, peptidase aspartic, catalytic [Tanacetum cinerariifolium]
MECLRKVSKEIKDSYVQSGTPEERTGMDLPRSLPSNLGKLGLDLDTFSSVRRPKSNGVIWMKKGSSNNSNVDLSSVNHLKLNKDVKHYSRKDLLSCNNSHLGETSSAYIVQIYLWIIDSGCSKHMTGNHALLTNFVEKFLGTVHFGNNDFAVIAGYGDVVLVVICFPWLHNTRITRSMLI